ncbi:MAG: RNA-guided endonuclease InsQ/TnpB family protein [Hormoscilla sp.]
MKKPGSSHQLELFAIHGTEIIPNVTLLGNNLNLCANSIQNRKTFQKLSEGLILDNGNLTPFWNELSSRISNGLSLPTETDSVRYENWLNVYARAIESNSWFSATGSSVHGKSLFKIKCPASTDSILGTTVCEEKKKSRKYGNNPFKKSQNIQPNSIKKIPVFPEPELHVIWKQWLAAYRWVYNQCIEFYNNNRALPEGRSLDQYIQQLQSEAKNEWTKCLGKTRQEAVCEAQSASRQSRKANGGKGWLRFRSCRSKSQVIQFKNDAYRNGTWFPSKIGNLKFVVAKGYELPINCVYGTELLYQRGQWFARFPSYVPIVCTGSDKVIALDPGNRTFLTGYDGENILEIGKGDIGRLTRLCLHLDNLIGRKMKATGKVNKRLRYKLNKAIDRLRFKIRSLVDDLHRQAASLLVNSYKLIFLPTYQTSQMVVKANRKINRKSVRNMLTWAIGRFASHLEQAAKRQGVLVVRCNEAYTSKTCPKCGHVHKKLGGSKVHFCPACGHKAPRDWVGAFNILLRALQAVAFDVRDGVITISDADVILAQSQYELCEG